MTFWLLIDLIVVAAQGLIALVVAEKTTL